MMFLSFMIISLIKLAYRVLALYIQMVPCCWLLK